MPDKFVEFACKDMYVEMDSSPRFIVHSHLVAGGEISGEYQAKGNPSTGTQPDKAVIQC